MALSPKDRDKFFRRWTLPDLLFQHLLSEAAHAAQDHAIVWGRINATFVGWLALLGGCIWLFSQTMATAQASAWVICLLLISCTALLLFVSMWQLLRAARPAYQSNPHSVEKLKLAWEASRDRFRKQEGASKEDELAHMARVERLLLLANWRDVAEDAAIQNKHRLISINLAFRFLLVAVCPFVVAVVLWFAISAPNTGYKAMTNQNPKNTPVVHPPTEVTERSKPGVADPTTDVTETEGPRIVHPTTEVVEKEGPPTTKK